MPANLTPDYIKADKWYREAATVEEKIMALEEMLRTIPKHKGTEHLQGDLKRKLSELKESATKKTGGKHTDIFHVPRNGAGQIVLLGTPNSGKSSIVAALTNAKVHVTDFPFGTHAPVPGMVKFEDIQIQLVDMPPITAEFSAPGQSGTYRNCDVIAMTIDLSGDIEEQILVCLDFLESKRLIGEQHNAADKSANLHNKKVLCIGTKSDAAAPDTFEKLKQNIKNPFEFIKISVSDSESLKHLTELFFKLLGVIRIYAKPPGKPADMTEPFTLAAGSNVHDLALHIHRELAEKLKSARVWGTGVHPGQNVHKTHILADKDIVELHFE